MGRSGDRGFGKDGGHFANSTFHKKGKGSSEYSMNEEVSRMEQRMMLQTQTSRKLLFQTGDSIQASQRQRTV